VAQRAKTVAVALLLALSAVVAAGPLAPAARAQPLAGAAQSEFTNRLPPQHFNATLVAVSSLSIVGYATRSNASIYTAFMDQQQLDEFARLGDVTDSIFYQSGTESYDALLEGPGTYYLVEFADSGAANVSALFTVNPDVDLRNSTTSVGDLVAIQPGETFALPLHVETLGSTSTVDIIGASTRVVQYALLDNTTGGLVYESPYVTFTNFTVFPATSVGYNFTLPPGQYVVGITDESPDPASVYFSYTIVPAYANPYLFATGGPSPTGVAAYGIYNRSGTIVPYEVETPSVVGYVEASALKAVDDQTGGHDCSIQENVVLRINDSDGATRTYWPQNVLSFDTGASTVTYRDNVLNITGDGAQLDNRTIEGTGTTLVDNGSGTPETYYGNYYSGYTYAYRLPQTWVLYTNETVEPGVGVLVSMGVRAPDGPDPGSVTWYDAITIVDPAASAAAFVVDGRSYTPAGAASANGMFYDAELVFGGGAGGQAATYDLDARLALFYLDQTLRPFPSLYTFGDDTAEAADNIAVSPGDGAAVARSGVPYYGILTNDFNSSLAALLAGPRSSSPPYLEYLAVGAAAAAIVAAAAVVLPISIRKKAPVGDVGGTAIPPVAFCGDCGAPVETDALFCPACGATQRPGPVGPTAAHGEGRP